MSHTAKGETILTGTVRDQSALYGVLTRLLVLGLQLVSVNSLPVKRDGLVPPGPYNVGVKVALHYPQSDVYITKDLYGPYMSATVIIK